MPTNRLFIAVSLLFLVGCKPAKEVFNEYWNDGTVEGASQCVALTSELLLTEEAIRRSCVSRFENRLSSGDLNEVGGRGSPQTRFGEEVFSGTLQNGNDGVVITRLFLEVRFVGSSEADVEVFSAEVSGWFEPNDNSVEFSSNVVKDAPDKWSAVDGCEAPGSIDCWTWAIDAAWGLRL